MPQYTLSVARPVRDRIAMWLDDEQREVRRLLGIIQLDPSIDGICKITYSRPPVVYTAYVTSQFWIVYHVMHQAIRVVDIWRVADNGQHPD